MNNKDIKLNENKRGKIAHVALSTYFGIIVSPAKHIINKMN